MSEAEMRALFLLAGFTVIQAWELPNGYWPEAYAEQRKASPWWLAMTEVGPIRIGWRKRVISIDWSGTSHRVEPSAVTPDDVTKDPQRVHAWSHARAVQYLENLRMAIKRAAVARPEAPGEKT